MALEDWIKTLELLVPIAKAVPVLGSPVEGSLEAAVKILQLAQGVKTNKEQTKELAEQAARWTQTLVNALDKVKTDTAALEHLHPNVTPIREVLNAIVKAIERRAKQSLAKQLMNRSKNEEELAKLRANLKDAHERFMVSSQIRNQITLSTLLTTADAETLKQLKPVSSSRYDSLASPPGCLAGTRQEILAQMLTWAKEPCQGFSVFWLAGLAGTGKSSIAKTFCEQTAVKNILMATFFASRSSADRRDPFNIIHTLAYELSVTDPRIRPEVLSTVCSPPDIMQRPMREQIERLMLVPLFQALNGRLLVLVIDALDECERIDGVEGGALIPLLADMLRSLPVKLVVTSRQETSLVGMFDSLVHIPLRLHEVATEVVEPDVRRILEAGFAKIRHGHKLTGEMWPSQEDLDSLVQLTGRFLIFATTALRYIGDSHFSPTEQLRQVLARGPALDGESAYAQIDALYSDILHAATRDDSGKINARLCQRIGDLLRTIVLLEEPLSVASLAHLIGASERDIAKAVGALSAFLFVADAQNQCMAAVRIFHPSLRDFLCDPERCRDQRFLVDISVQHHVLAGRCLLVLNRPGALERDICRLENPSRANSEILDLAVRLQSYVPGSVQYACVFWPVHLCVGEPPTDTIYSSLLAFCQTHLFHWIELLSLLARLPAAATHLPTVISWLRSPDVSLDSARDASELLNDAYRMLLAYYPPIDSHALHVYESAVATMPECALFATVDTGTAANVHLIAHRQGSWPATLRVIEVGRSSALLGGVSSLSFSPDGTQLASRSDFNKLKIWSVKTGAQLAVFEMAGRHSRISEQAETHHLIFDTCVAYSPDGTQIVFSFSSGSIVWLALWDTKTYQQLAVLRDPRDSMGQAVTRRLPISFLPGSSLVIFGCDDGTIYVWDPAGNIGTMRFGRNTTSKVWAVACSPNGSKIVSGLANGLLRVWHSETGARLATLEGHSEKVNSVAFSPNGAQLVSGSDDWSIRIWDMRMNEIICVLQSHGYPVTPMVQSPEVTSVAFSPDGRQVVSGSCDKTVRIWDVQSTKQITLLQGHHKEVLSVSFSPDGTLVASGAADGTMWVWDMQTLPPVVDIPEDPNREPTHEIAISTNGAHLVSTAGILGRVWDMQSRREIAVLDGHTDIIWVVSFSPDSNGLRIVTGSRDKTVRVWYTQTGQELARFSVNNRPSAVALSADGTRVVVGMDNARMPVWDVLSGEQLALLVGHRDEMLAVALSPDGLRVVSRSTKTTRLWDVATGDQVAVIGGRDNFSSTVTFCPDGLRVISCSYAGLIQAWDTITRAHIALVEGLDCSVTVVAHSFKDVWFHTPGRVLRLTFDSGDIMIYQHGDDMPSFEDVDDTQSTASRINASPMGKPARSAITWDQATGWLLCGSVPNGPIPLCWLPVERRGPAMICGRMVAVGGAGGKLTMLDFTQTIERLHNQGIVQSP